MRTVNSQMLEMAAVEASEALLIADSHRGLSRSEHVKRTERIYTYRERAVRSALMGCNGQEILYAREALQGSAKQVLETVLHQIFTS